MASDKLQWNTLDHIAAYCPQKVTWTAFLLTKFSILGCEAVIHKVLMGSSRPVFRLMVSHRFCLLLLRTPSKPLAYNKRILSSILSRAFAPQRGGFNEDNTKSDSVANWRERHTNDTVATYAFRIRSIKAGLVPQTACTCSGSIISSHSMNSIGPSHLC